MAERSNVSSVEAIEAFRAKLIVFLSKARPTVEEVAAEVTRMGLWLENDQRNFWIKELRALTRKLQEAQAELFSARISKLKAAASAEELNLQRAKRELREAEEKQAVTKRWSRELEDRTQPLVKEVQQLHTYLTTDMVKAVEYLVRVVKTLDAYAGVAPPSYATGGAETSTAEAPSSEPAGEKGESS
jgi:chromosome segregation ATPase